MRYLPSTVLFLLTTASLAGACSSGTGTQNGGAGGPSIVAPGAGSGGMSNGNSGGSAGQNQGQAGNNPGNAGAAGMNGVGMSGAGGMGDNPFLMGGMGGSAGMNGAGAPAAGMGGEETGGAPAAGGSAGAAGAAGSAGAAGAAGAAGSPGLGEPPPFVDAGVSSGSISIKANRACSGCGYVVLNAQTGVLSWSGTSLATAEAFEIYEENVTSFKLRASTGWFVRRGTGGVLSADVDFAGATLFEFDAACNSGQNCTSSGACVGLKQSNVAGNYVSTEQNGTVRTLQGNKAACSGTMTSWEQYDIIDL